jgi:hypothetical protein
MEKAAEDIFGPKLDQDLRERDSRYGKFRDNGRVSQELKCALRSGTFWHRLTAPQKEALEMIAVKMGRIVSGDCGKQPDSWYDIAGFAKLGSGETD